jgi:L-gulono-1,4-lactone dehydrogenase
VSEPSDQRLKGSGPDLSVASWRNWTGDQRCAPTAIERPSCIEDIAAALSGAADAGLRVRAVGSGHSFSDIACTDGMQIRLDGLTKLLDVDRTSGLVRVQAGITIRELNGRLAEHGLALENLGDIDAQTIAGAISTATHGTGSRLANIPAQLAELTLVLADGSTLLCSPQRDADTFRAARVGLGCLGIVAEVTLRCVPAFRLCGIDSSMRLGEALERFEECSLHNDHFEFYVFPYADLALTRTNNRTREPARPPGKLSSYLNDVLLVNHAFGLFCRLGRAMPSQIPRINRLMSRLAGGRKRVDESHAIFATPRLVRFTEMEYALPRSHVPEAVRAVLSMVERERLPVPFPIEVRCVAADDAFLSTAAGRDSGYVAVHMFEGMAFETYFRAVEAIMDDLQGRPHWGKRHFQTAQTLRHRYPDWDRFQAVRTRLDPSGLFGNEWTDRVLGPVKAAAAEPAR